MDPANDSRMATSTLLPAVPSDVHVALPRSWSKAMCSIKMVLYLGQPNCDPSLCLELPKGFYGDILLHNQSTPSDSPSARATNNGRWMENYSISLGPSAAAGSDEKPEKFRRDGAGKGAWWFAMTVGQGASQEVERFEWRQSSGAFKRLFYKTCPDLELVRLRGSEDLQQSQGEKDSAATKKLTKDGGEIVAVWKSSNSWKTVFNLGDLHFQGSALSSEALDRKWRVMALLSCICILQKWMRDLTIVSVVT